MQYDDKDATRFLEKISKNENGCWNWTASCFNSRMGYGAFGLGRLGDFRVVTAHRFSYTYHKGLIPQGLCVLHTCDNPKCVNPEHLWLGTYLDNNRDMRDKGRSSRKLDPLKVREIRSSTLSTRELARKFSVSQHMIMRVLTRIAWNHVP